MSQLDEVLLAITSGMDHLDRIAIVFLKDKKLAIDCHLIVAGAILHDIGRCRSHRLDHGIIGAKILRKEGIVEEVAQVAENHLFGGITKTEAREFGLPFTGANVIVLE